MAFCACYFALGVVWTLPARQTSALLGLLGDMVQIKFKVAKSIDSMSKKKGKVHSSAILPSIQSHIKPHLLPSNDPNNFPDNTAERLVRVELRTHRREACQALRSNVRIYSVNGYPKPRRPIGRKLRKETKRTSSSRFLRACAKIGRVFFVQCGRIGNYRQVSTGCWD
jgi:hypothetical protein